MAEPSGGKRKAETGIKMGNRNRESSQGNESPWKIPFLLLHIRIKLSCQAILKPESWAVFIRKTEKISDHEQR